MAGGHRGFGWVRLPCLPRVAGAILVFLVSHLALDLTVSFSYMYIYSNVSFVFTVEMRYVFVVHTSITIGSVFATLAALVGCQPVQPEPQRVELLCFGFSSELCEYDLQLFWVHVDLWRA